MHIPHELRTQLISEYPMYKPYIIDLVIHNIADRPNKEFFTQEVKDFIKESHAQTQAQKDAIIYQSSLLSR